MAHGEAVFEVIDGVRRAVRYVGTLRDITGRKAAEERHRFLMREVIHRVRNTLAGVRAIAASTLRNARSLTEAEAVLSARINALANVHTLLGGGHDGLAGLDEIVATVVAPYRDGPDRIRLRGPPVALAERDALALAIAVHELVANAVAHGSLSAATGTVAVDWTVAPAADGSDLRLTWREAGGPPVEPPRHRGLGTRLIEQAFGGPDHARVELSFLPGGVVCAIQARLSAPPPPAAAAGS
jgi:two-component sensor histidine kinase